MTEDNKSKKKELPSTSGVIRESYSAERQPDKKPKKTDS